MTKKLLHHEFSGVVLAIAAPLIYSTSIPLSKVFLTHTQPWMLAGLLDLGAALGMAGVYWLRPLLFKTPVTNPVELKDWKWIVGSIFAGSLLAPVLQIYGIAHSTAASASLLLNLEGVFTAVISWVVFRERFDRHIAGGLLIITLGSTMLVWSGDATHFSWGSLLVMGGALAWASSSNLLRQFSSRDPVQITLIKTSISGTVNVSLALLIGDTLPGLPILGAIALMGFLCIGMTYVLYIVALRKLGTASVGTYFAIFPFIGAILAVVFLQEPVTVQLLISGGLMAIGLGISLRRRKLSV